jgi:hypothetical protein
MNDEVEELIKEIAAKHGIAVSRDDPILVLQTINHRLMEDCSKACSKAQQIQLDRCKEELEDLAARWGNDAKNKAERILNAALFAAKDAMDREMNDGVKALATAVRTEIDVSLSGVANLVRDARRMAIFNVVAACITLLAAGVALWVVLRGGTTVQLMLSEVCHHVPSAVLAVLQFDVSHGVDDGLVSDLL